MARICSIHQPSYWPYLGLFDKVARSDVFVFLDDVQYVKNDFKNRNRIFINSPASAEASRTDWLTLPVRHDSMTQTIQETQVVKPVATLRRHANTLRQAYGTMSGFQELSEVLLGLLGAHAREPLGLADLDIATTQFAFDVFGIKADIAGRSSAIENKSTDPTQRLIDICRHVGADTYLAGAGGREYMQVEEFERQGIRLLWQEWKPFPYEQKHSAKEFVPYLSCLDLLFNLGGESREFFANLRATKIPCSPTATSP
jgi:hypothetical protein